MSFFSKQIDKRIAAYQRELIETHYREVENMYRQIRGWRHDYRNHIQMMKVLAANGDMDALKVYLDELDTDLNTVDTVVKTGNPMADAILNSKISLARSRDIPTQVDAHIPVKLKMSELDLCCIIGNLMDNAMDAGEDVPGGRIRLAVTEDLRGFAFVITNNGVPIPEELVDRLFEPGVSTKGEGHGLGLSIVRSTLADFGGTISLETGPETVFTVTVPRESAGAPKPAPEGR